ncbi:MAG TPA: DUF2878 family protein [Pseudobdellovibrionaceae bacterium]|nr:DUF2878 family protein [Pseudobdellovibrionaceae bacterium]
MQVVATFLGFQASWWILVLSADHAATHVFACGLAAVWTLVAKVRGHRRWRELAGFAAGGWLAETLLQNLNLVAYVGEFKLHFAPQFTFSLPPLWLIALWYILAVVALETPKFWLRLRSRWWLAPMAGALGGLSSYAPGPSLGALTWPQGPTLGLLAVASVWALACWVLVHRFSWSPHHDPPQH